MSLLLLLLAAIVPPSPIVKPDGSAGARGPDAPGSDWFYPNAGLAIARIERDATGERIGGLPIERTGLLLARVTDLTVLSAMPEVAEVELLGGDGHVVRIRPRPGVDEVALSRALRGRPGVVWAHPDLILEMTPQAIPNDPFFSDAWHLKNTGQRGWTLGVDINAELAWTRTTGKGGIVSVIDSGVDGKHPDLRVTLGHDYIGGDEDSSPEIGKDGAPHGTAVAGTTAAIGDNGVGVAGVAHGASIYGIRLIGGRASLGDFYGAFAESVDAGAWVLNNSWGYGDKCDEVPDFSAYKDAMEYAENEGRGGLGAAVVFAAGNGNCDIEKNYLLAQPQVITVAATNGDDRREDYSAFGVHVDVAGPSGTILTTDIAGKEGYGDWKGDLDYHGSFSGTSAATPVVSGVVLLMFAANPRLTAAQARRVLCETAAKVDLKNGKYNADGWSPYYGCGRVDAGAAVMAVANSAPSAPTVVAPREQAWTERVILRWQPATDADSDWLSYRVAYRVEGSTAETVVDVPGTRTHLDITPSVTLDQRVVFSVEARDLWGAGGRSAETTFSVVAHPVWEPPMMTPMESGCGVARGKAARGESGALALGLLVLFGLLRRRD